MASNVECEPHCDKRHNHCAKPYYSRPGREIYYNGAAVFVELGAEILECIPEKSPAL